jgi:hypothetical protein
MGGIIALHVHGYIHYAAVGVCVVCGCLGSSTALLYREQGNEPGATCSHMFWEVWWQIPLGDKPEVRHHDSNLVGVHFSIAHQAQFLEHVDQSFVDMPLGEDADGVDDQEVCQDRFVCRDLGMANAPFESRLV